MLAPTVLTVTFVKVGANGVPENPQDFWGEMLARRKSAGILGVKCSPAVKQLRRHKTAM